MSAITKYDNLALQTKKIIESKSEPFKPSVARLLGHIVTTFLLAPSAIGTLLYTPAGKILTRFNCMDLTKLSPRTKAITFISSSFLVIFSLVYRVIKFGKNEDLATIKGIYEQVKDKLSDKEFTDIELGGTVFYFTKEGYSTTKPESKTFKPIKDLLEGKEEVE